MLKKNWEGNGTGAYQIPLLNSVSAFFNCAV